MDKLIVLAGAGAFCICASAIADVHKITRDGMFGCTSKDRFEKHVRLLREDQVAFKHALVRDLKSGQCVGFERGQRVFLDDTAVFSGMTKVRPEGDDQGYWTFFEATH